MTKNKLTNIPTNLIMGFLGVGKTTAILDLLKQKPKHEKWTVLVNEFGKIGIDGAIFPQREPLEAVYAALLACLFK
jgi:G3E family GTPase